MLNVFPAVIFYFTYTETSLGFCFINSIQIEVLSPLYDFIWMNDCTNRHALALVLQRIHKQMC